MSSASSSQRRGTCTASGSVARQLVRDDTDVADGIRAGVAISGHAILAIADAALLPMAGRPPDGPPLLEGKFKAYAALFRVVLVRCKFATGYSLVSRAHRSEISPVAGSVCSVGLCLRERAGATTVHRSASVELMTSQFAVHPQYTSIAGALPRICAESIRTHAP
jgi:hypothetical protein